MRPVNITVLNAVPDTGNATSAAQDSSFLFRCSVIAKFADSTAVGNLVLQGSNDQPPASNQAQLFTPTTWAQIATQAVSAGGTVAIPPTEICYQWIRVLFTYTSGGSSTVTAKLYALGQ